VYHFASLAENHIFQVKVPADHERPEVPSITPLWIGANLQEREIYDLMGVVFTGHPELTRLFLWDQFPGHPLRKDFMALPGGQKSGLSQFPKQVKGQTGGEFRPRLPGTGE
jgi:NADH-quinone oxidoreductase subunit C